MPPTSWIRIDFSIVVPEWPGDFPEEGGKGHEMSHVVMYRMTLNNNRIDNNNKKKDGEDESVSAHLPAGTPTGCV